MGLGEKVTLLYKYFLYQLHELGTLLYLQISPPCMKDSYLCDYEEY